MSPLRSTPHPPTRAQTGRSEHITAKEKRENLHFLSACMKRPVMRYAHKFLLKCGAIPAECKDVRKFLRLLDSIWFHPYRRRATNDSRWEADCGTPLRPSRAHFRPPAAEARTQ